MPRPELTGPPEFYYNEQEARKYTQNSRIIQVQEHMSSRAIELLNLTPDSHSLILDLGCGSGLSGEHITEAGHFWIGCDISQAMLDVALEREVEGDLILSDLGEGVGFFRPGSFDAAISVSAIQWLCVSNSRVENPVRRLYWFFTTLYSVLKKGGKVALQFYPETPDQVELITQQATRVGFQGGIVVDYPNSAKAKKFYLVLCCGAAMTSLPQGLCHEGAAQVKYSEASRDPIRKTHNKIIDKAKIKGSKAWILRKKERMRAQGKEVARDSKYTGRKRSSKF